MKHFVDGDQLCITRDDFVNLQESPVVFYPLDSVVAKTVLIFGLFLEWVQRVVDWGLKRALREQKREVELCPIILGPLPT